ncbi:MAG: hypothetical protein K2N83_00815, partial [Eubacterium sp.]|nr:hypothetical protein [Eubacterium sp.]
TRGYRNEIKPILDVLGCDDAVTKEQFVLDANGRGEEGDADYVAGNTDYVLYNILNPVINKIGTIMDDPLNQALDLVTSLAAFVDKGGLQKAIEELLYPITQMFGPIIKLATRGVPELEGSTDIFSIALSFVDLGDGVTWDNLHTMLPTIVQSFLTIRVMDKQVNGKYVKVLSRQVVNDQEKVETQYYTVTTESKPVLDEDGNEVKDDDGNTLYQDEEVETIVAASNVTEIVGIEINGTIYKLDIDGIKIDLANLAYCMINAKASDDESDEEDASTFAARAAGDATDEEDSTVDEEAIAKTRRSDAFVALYRFIRRAIDANADNLIMPLVQNSLPASTYDAIDEYIENVIFVPNSEEGDNILITLIRIADSLGTELDFDVEYDAHGTGNANSWLSLLQITAAKAVNGEYTDKTTQADTARAITTIWGTVNN